MAVNALSTRPIPLRLLLWLRWRMLTRGMGRSKARWVGTLLAVLVLGPWALALAAGCFFGLWKLPVGTGRLSGEVLIQAGLSLTGLLWVLAPLLGFALNESYDITRLFVYPVARTRLFLGALLGSFLDLPVLLLLPSFVGGTVGLALHNLPAALAAAIALPLFLIQTLALSQGLLLASQGILRSRKFRDIALVVVPLFWMAYQIGIQTFGKSMEHGMWARFATSPLWKAFSVLPSGIAAHAVGAAGRSEWAHAAGWLLGLATITAVTVRVVGWLVGKAYDGEEVGSGGAVQRVASVRTEPERDNWSRRLPPATAAILRKDLILFRRDPFYRVLLMNLVYSIGFGAFMLFTRMKKTAELPFGESSVLVDSLLLGATALALLQQSALFYNQFGAEGMASPVLFGSPARRRDILLGKNLSLLLGAGVVDIVISVALSLVARHPDALALLLPFTLLGTVILLAAGNIISLFFPNRVEMKGFKTRQGMPSQGFGQAMLYLMLFFGVNVLQAPIAAAFFVPRHWVDPVWLAVTAPVAALYAVGLYLLSLKLAEPLLLEREQAILERLTRTADA